MHCTEIMGPGWHPHAPEQSHGTDCLFAIWHRHLVQPGGHQELRLATLCPAGWLPLRQQPTHLCKAPCVLSFLLRESKDTCLGWLSLTEGLDSANTHGVGTISKLQNDDRSILLNAAAYLQTASLYLCMPTFHHEFKHQQALLEQSEIQLHCTVSSPVLLCSTCTRVPHLQDEFDDSECTRILCICRKRTLLR